MSVILLAAISLGAADEGDTPPPQKYVYMFEKPQPVESKLIVRATFAHFAFELGKLGVKAGLAYQFHGGLNATIIPIVLGVSTYYSSVKAYRKQQLHLIDWMKQNQAIDRINQIPGIQEVALLKIDDFKGKKLPNEKRSDSLMFIETDQPLPPYAIAQKQSYWNAAWGEPKLINNLSETKIKIRMQTDYVSSMHYWEIPISEIFSAKRLPKETAEQWRDDYDIGHQIFEEHHLKDKIETLARAKNAWRHQGLKLETIIVSPDGTETHFGTMTDAQAWGVLGKGAFKSAIRTGFNQEAQLPLRSKNFRARGRVDCIVKWITSKFMNQHEFFRGR